MTRRKSLAVAAALALAGCGGGGEAEKERQAPIPAAACDSVQKALANVGKGAMFEFNDRGEATVLEEQWRVINAGDKDRMVEGLAMHAACAAGGTASEQVVVIRNENGRVLTDRVVPVSQATRIED